MRTASICCEPWKLPSVSGRLGSQTDVSSLMGSLRHLSFCSIEASARTKRVSWRIQSGSGKSHVQYNAVLGKDNTDAAPFPAFRYVNLTITGPGAYPERVSAVVPVRGQSVARCSFRHPTATHRSSTSKELLKVKCIRGETTPTDVTIRS